MYDVIALGELLVDFTNNGTSDQGNMQCASCKNGKVIANQIAEEWHIKYKRRAAMMDELRKSGY